MKTYIEFVRANKLSDQGMSLNRSQCLAARRSTAPRPIGKSFTDRLMHSPSVSCVDWRGRRRAMTPPTTNQPVLVYTNVHLSWVDHQRVHRRYRDIQWTGCCLRGVQT